MSANQKSMEYRVTLQLSKSLAEDTTLAAGTNHIALVDAKAALDAHIVGALDLVAGVGEVFIRPAPDGVVQSEVRPVGLP
jgi:hypothetical protein